MDKPVDAFVLTLRKLSEESEKRIAERKVAVYKRAIDILIKDCKAEIQQQISLTGVSFHHFFVKLNQEIVVDTMADHLGTVMATMKFMEDFVKELKSIVGLRVNLEYVAYSKSFTVFIDWSKDPVQEKL